MHVLVHYAREDKKLAEKFLIHLRGVPGVDLHSYEKDIQEGQIIQKRQLEINDQADAILLLLSADFTGNDRLMQEASQMMHQRSDLVENGRFFVLFARPTIWYLEKSSAFHILYGGGVPRQEKERIQAIQEMLVAYHSGPRLS